MLKWLKRVKFDSCRNDRDGRPQRIRDFQHNRSGDLDRDFQFASKQMRDSSPARRVFGARRPPR